jgi:hypothetical protein
MFTETEVLPAAWLEGTVHVSYEDCSGVCQETSGTLLAFCPFGPVLDVGGTQTVISWYRIVLCELVEEGAA